MGKPVSYTHLDVYKRQAQEIAADPGKVDAALDLLMVIKYLERIGDHASDIAEIIPHLVTVRKEGDPAAVSYTHLYAQLVDWYNKGDLDFSEVTTVNLDEYRGPVSYTYLGDQPRGLGRSHAAGSALPPAAAGARGGV